MNTKKNIPDAETRARNVARLREINKMWDEINLKLELAQALAEADLQNSPLYVSRRERLRKELEIQEQQKLVSQQD